MDFSRDIMLSYLEEDNTQRAYFRARPLLTPEALIHEEALRAWPDHGALRIVPDRNEQHTFKDRMRAIGSYCVVDLTRFPPEANKIRTNKNYRPDGSEPNQYIVFSDAVQAVPESPFFEVLEARPEDAAQKAAQAITPLFYLRSGDTFYGPVRKSDPQTPQPAEETTGTLFDITSPDGSIHTILSVRAEQAAPAEPVPEEAAPEAAEASTPAPASVPAPAGEAQPEGEPAAEPARSEALPIGKPLQILEPAQSFEETLEALDQPLSSGANLLKESRRDTAAPAAGRENDSKLSGTPLYHSPVSTSTPRVKNKLQEVVSNQWHAAKNDPPAQPLPEGAKLHDVPNPVDQAVQALTKAWQYPETRTQLVNLLLSMEGMHTLMEERQTGAIRSRSPLQAAMKRHLENLETERLTLLVQLDRAKADTEAWRKEMLTQVAAKRRAELDNLSKRIEAHEKTLNDLKEQIRLLTEQRNSLEDELLNKDPELFRNALQTTSAQYGLKLPSIATPLRLSPVSGVEVSPDEMIDRLARAAEASGIQLHRNAAVAGMALLANCPRVGLVVSSGAEAVKLLRRLAAAMGWKDSFALQVDPKQIPVKYAAPPEPTPSVLVTTLPSHAAIDGVCKLMLVQDKEEMTKETSYQVDPWPIYPLRFGALSETFDIPSEPPVSLRSLRRMAEQATGSEEDIRRILEPMIRLANPLSDDAYAEVLGFVRTASGYMNGGLAAACDWATALWLLPRIPRSEETDRQLEELLREYPVSTVFMKEYR